MNMWHPIAFAFLILSILVMRSYDYSNPDTLMRLYFSGMLGGIALCGFVMSFYEQSRSRYEEGRRDESRRRNN